MTKSERDTVRERIAMGINHGLDDVDILADLTARDIKVSRPTLIAIIRDLMSGPEDMSRLKESPVRSDDTRHQY